MEELSRQNVTESPTINKNFMEFPFSLTPDSTFFQIYKYK